MAVVGVLLIFLFPGSPEQDVDYHFCVARPAWVDHSYFVDVWGRPLFTALFAPVALLGFIPARFFALAISVAAAWQTYRLACDLRMSCAWLVFPFLLGQQTFFELYSNLFTEPLFALVLVIALRHHFSGRIKSGMLVASLLPLARPEGVFVCLLWGAWVLILLERQRSLRAGNSEGVVQPPDLIDVNAPPVPGLPDVASRSVRHSFRESRRPGEVGSLNDGAKSGVKHRKIVSRFG